MIAATTTTTTNNGGFPWSGLEAGADLQAAIARAATGDELRVLQDRVTRQAIEAQIAAGCDLITDGLVRRADPAGSVIAGLAGVEVGPGRTGFPAGGGAYRVPVVRGEVSWTGPLVTEDYLFAARGIDRPLKVVLTGPYTLAMLAEDHAYGEPMALAMALATALNQELRALLAAGAPVIQIDEPGIVALPGDFPLFTRIWEVLGRGVSSGLALHLEGGAIAPLAAGLGRLKRLTCLSVDCASVPENLEALAAVSLPEGAAVGIGLVSGSAASVETAEDLAARVRGAAGLLTAGRRILLGTGQSLAALPLQAASAKLAALDRARRLLAAS